MAENFEHLAQLILNNWQGQATESEKNELNNWLNASDKNIAWLRQFENTEWVKAELEEYSSYDLEESRQRLWAKINANETEEQVPEPEIEPEVQAEMQPKLQPEIQPRRINFNTPIWWAAAVILLVVSVILFIIPHSAKEQLTTYVDNDAPPESIISDSNHIVLMLANGAKFIMNSMQINETVSKEFGVYIEDHKLKFKKTAGSHKKEKSNYNKLIIPKGGFYQLELADGSNVWLNSSSTITFPAVDTGNTRSINITGEAYLEVKKDKRPFIVNLPAGVSMEVLGTNFNVNTYPDEPYIGVTLVEGHVIVKKAGKSKTIEPGQQCRIDGMNIEAKDVDVNAIVAWKDSRFDFENDSLTTIVRQLSRWYDVHVQYIDTPRVVVSYFGNRTNPIDTTIKALNAGRDNFKIRLTNDTLVIHK